MRANDPDAAVVDAGVAGASIAAVLARGGSEVLLLSWPAPLAHRGVHRPAPRIAAGFMAVPTASIGIPRAVSEHAVTSAPEAPDLVTSCTIARRDAARS
jgi:choline dehydrogenase-like flavoprotein